MILLAHTITGAVIGEKISNPLLVSLIAFISHFLLDRIPHWNYKVPKKFNAQFVLNILPDIIPSVLIYVFFLFSYPEQWLTITLGVTFAILPDFLALSQYVPKIDKFFQPLLNFHKFIQGKIKNKNMETFYGLLTQIIYLGILMMIFVYV